jgi:uncharacterized lipoprotein YddW (UPF0748 family)
MGGLKPAPTSLIIYTRMRRLAVALTALLICSTALGGEYRAFWVESFNTPLGTRADIDQVIETAAKTNANALFVQIRRRADSWYVETREPLTEVAGVGEPAPTGEWTLDPLRYLIEQAHARNIEVHAFVIVGSVFREDPAVHLPADPDHVFLQHIWDREKNAPYTDERQWATRALPHNPSGTSYDGQRFGQEWYIDLGHPDAAAYSVNVLSHLIRNYDIDGIHMDRIRYPESALDRYPGKPSGSNVGYNATSVARFNAQHGRTGMPASNDPLWNQWRRDQVTSFVRTLYQTVKSIRPAVRVSAALVTFGAGPTRSKGFENTGAYNWVFQDWQTWANEGILDLFTPMIYKRDHVPNESAQFNDWTRFVVNLAHTNRRLAVTGIGAYLNRTYGTLRQARFARDAGADGVILYSMYKPSRDKSTHAYFLKSLVKDVWREPVERPEPPRLSVDASRALSSKAE